MSWTNCHDHDIDYRKEDGCPVCNLCIERDQLKARVAELEKALDHKGKEALERAAQICRYYLKHQNFHGDWGEMGEYDRGVIATCENLEQIILLGADRPSRNREGVLSMLNSSNSSNTSIAPEQERELCLLIDERDRYREAYEATKGMLTLLGRIHKSGPVPHADYWHQSLYEADERIRIAESKLPKPIVEERGYPCPLTSR